jgi:hypothetical protein
MSDTKFTPGPWSLMKKGNLCNAVEASCGVSKYGERWSVVCTYQHALSDPSERSMDEEHINSEANGNLIASAPIMYEALEDVEKVLQYIVEEYPGHLKDLRNVQRALSIARGEAQ